MFSVEPLPHHYRTVGYNPLPNRYSTVAVRHQTPKFKGVFRLLLLNTLGCLQIFFVHMVGIAPQGRSVKERNKVIKVIWKVSYLLNNINFLST